MAEESARLDSTRVRKIVRVGLGGQGKLGQDLQKQPVAAPLVGTSIGAPLGSCTKASVTVPAVFNLRIDRWMQVPGAFLFGDCVGTRDANNVFPLRQMRRTLPPPRESRFNADPTPSS
ncbi:hypothetical protein BHM03_00000037 [Ensete ventricosum]|uniref:Uncharacterized protein n=1 Tax=Ensete ventricosum TaxID=4639 RepID=A0A445M858_ENSVE|nr:hypothetical protein BHM03_00000037 [Ensete ventricosum]